MENQTHIKGDLTLGSDHLAYLQLGSGPKTLLAFHGFGQSKEIFKAWEAVLGAHYTLFAFDLFYHGESSRDHSKLSKENWKLIIEAFLTQQQISRFEIVGYSLGGRFAIATSLAFPERVERMTLIAPDAIYLTIWFKLATAPVLRSLTKFIMIHPTLLDRLLAFNDRAGIVNSYVADFIRKELGDTTNRRRVYMSWNNFKTLGYSKKELSFNFSKTPFKKMLILGTKDQVLPMEKLLPIIRKMGSFTISKLPMKHHQLIRPEVANLLR